MLNNQSSLKNINIGGVKFDDTVSEENNGFSLRSHSKIALKNKLANNNLHKRKNKIDEEQNLLQVP